MATKKTCESVLQFGDDTLHCDLPEDHVEPTEALPQGTPHSADDHPADLSGDPLTWWG